MKARCKKELRLSSFTFEVDKEYDFEVKEIHLPAKMSQVVLARGFETRHLQYATHIEAYPPHLCGHIPGQGVPEKWPITVFFYDRQYCISKKWRSNSDVLGVFGDELYCFEEFFTETDERDQLKHLRILGMLPNYGQFRNKILNEMKTFDEETKASKEAWAEMTKGEPEPHYKGEGKKAVSDDFGLEAFFKMRNEEMLAQMNTADYNGGISVMDFGLMKLPLPVPEKDKKWALRWHDTPKGEVLPELVQVPVSDPNIEWREGYPKYK